ncbi:MAG: hypothetical protein ACE5D8_02170 [Fidelibacterota bacterium]
MTRIFILLLMLPVLNQGQSGYTGLNAWYHANTVALAGSGSVISGPSSDQLNPAAMLPERRSFSIGAILYPADIRATQLGFVFPRVRSTIAVTVRHLNYGIFEGYDNQGGSTTTYTSGDTWLSLAYARDFRETPLRVGLTVGGFFSSLESFAATALTLTPGLAYVYTPLNITLGLSLQNSGTVVKNYTSYRAPLPRRLVLGFAKKLAHLPMTICMDYSHYDETEGQLRLGGIITLSPAIDLRWGTSTDKLDQVTNMSVQRDFLGSSSLGLAIHYDAFRFSVGSYFYGTGGWIHGLGCDIDF